MKAVSIILALAVMSGVLDTSVSYAGDENLDYIKARQRVLDGKWEEAVPLLEKALKADPESAYINSQLSEAYLRVGNYESAEQTAAVAVAKEPTNLEYRATYAGILAALKRYPESKEQYSKILEADPDNQKIPLLLGLLQAESGQLEEGVKTLSKAVDETSDNFMALFYRAKIYLEMDQIPKAKADLERVLTLRPSLVEAGTALGLLQERLGEVDEAIKTYSRIQGGGRFKKRLAQLYLGKNDLEKALECLQEYSKEEPDDYTARVKIGLIYYEQKQWQKAESEFVAILKEQTDADNVRFYLGAVYEETNQHDKALVEFKKVSKDSTFFKEAMIHVGFLYKETQRINEGLGFAKTLTTRNPDVVEFIDLYASFYELQKKFAQALAIIEGGLKRFPSEERLLYFQGALQEKLGDRRKAAAIMRQLIAINANNAHALNFLGYILAELGENLDEAEKLVSKALTLRPNDGFIEDSLGWILFKAGKVDEAIVRLENAHRLQPEEAIILEHLGDAHLKRKEVTRATEYYKKALALTQKRDRDTSKKLEEKIAVASRDQRTPSAN